MHFCSHFFLSFYNCKSQERTLLKRLNDSFINHVVDNNTHNSEDEINQYLNGKVKVLQKCRELFFSELNLHKVEKDANLIEIFDSFSSDFYRAILQIDKEVYLFTTYDEFFNFKFEVTDVVTYFKNQLNDPMACALQEAINKNFDDIMTDSGASNFHFSLYISAIEEQNISIYIYLILFVS